MTLDSEARHTCRPSRLEIAAGTVLGRAPGDARPPFLALPQPPALSPLAALERAILPALHRSPCLVSFSGSTASSFVLALAAGLAREAGLRPPVPVTWRATDSAAAQLSTWQARVIAALPIADWLLLDADDDADPVGPIAQQLLAKHGVLHPGSADVALHLPIIERARGGALLTGSGGTQLLSGKSGAPFHAPGVTDRLTALASASRQRPGADHFPWLHPEIARLVSTRQQRDLRSEPRRIDRRIDWHARSRELLMARAALETAAADRDVLLVDPFLDRVFCTALRFLTRRLRGLSGHELLLAVAAGTVPEVVTALRPRSPLPGPFLREPTRTFISRWDGHGADGTYVNAGVLRRIWSMWPVPVGTVGIVQQLWVAAHDGAAKPARLRGSGSSQRSVTQPR